jgi:hypothetical protein
MALHTHTSKSHNRKNLLRYIHTQSYSRISGFKGVKAQEGTARKRILTVITALVLMAVGLIFVFV